MRITNEVNQKIFSPEATQETHVDQGKKEKSVCRDKEKQSFQFFIYL